MFHWPLAELLELTVDELDAWHVAALDRYEEHMKVVMSPWTKS